MQIANAAAHAGFPDGTVVKILPADAGAIGDVGSIPGSGRTPGEGHGNPLQYSCLGYPMDRGAWWASPWGHKKFNTTVNACTLLI